MVRTAILLSAALTLAACAVHHVTPYVPDASIVPQSADAASASANCTEASIAAELAICASPQLIATNLGMIQALHADLRAASSFGRDALLADQRAWLLALPVQCHLADPRSPAIAGNCLEASMRTRISLLRAWPTPPVINHGALTQYVSLRPAAGASRPDPVFCNAFALRANVSLRQSGMLDPAAMGYQEIAGSHGPPAAPPNSAAPPISVDVYDANVFASFERRARNVAVAGKPVITPASLTQIIEAQNTTNQGGRFSAFASQTGDYGSIDVFRDNARVLAIAADPWGATTPAAPGEAAHAGIWSLGATAIGSIGATPVCLFDTYVRPAEPGPFDTLPNFSPWRDTLTQIRDSTDLPLGNAVKRDQAQLGADTDFTVLHMPLLAVQQANAPGQTLWLRHRHDQVLDALYAWSTRSAANKALFDRAFALLRPAAEDLVRAYQATQGLSATEATQAGGIAIMELLYQATTTISPALGKAPEMNDGSKPRYPILGSSG